MRARARASASATCWSTSTRTRTGRSTRSCARSPAGTATCAWSATTTSRSTAGAAPTSRSILALRAATSRARRSCGSRRTTARPQPILERREPRDRATTRAPREDAALGARRRATRSRAARCEDDEATEAEHVAREIQQLVRAARGALGDFAVLFRTATQPRAFEAQLRARAVPYVLVGGMSFFDRKEVRDVLAYLRLAGEPARRGRRFLRVVNCPPRGDRQDDDRARRSSYATRARRARVAAGLRARGRDRGLTPRRRRPWRDFAPAARDAGAQRARAATLVALRARAARGRRLPRARSSAATPTARARGALGRGEEVARTSPRTTCAARESDGRRSRASSRSSTLAAEDDPTQRGPRRAQRGHADDAARREGPRVPARLPRRPRGGAPAARARASPRTASRRSGG